MYTYVSNKGQGFICNPCFAIMKNGFEISECYGGFMCYDKFPAISLCLLQSLLIHNIKVIWLKKHLKGIFIPLTYLHTGILLYSPNTDTLHIFEWVAPFLQSIKLIPSKLVEKKSKEEKVVETFWKKYLVTSSNTWK